VFIAVFEGTVAWLPDALFARFADHAGMTSKVLVLRLWVPETSRVLSTQIPHWDALSAWTNRCEVFHLGLSTQIPHWDAVCAWIKHAL
jgi:hypothetical protein